MQNKIINWDLGITDTSMLVYILEIYTRRQDIYGAQYHYLFLRYFLIIY